MLQCCSAAVLRCCGAAVLQCHSSAVLGASDVTGHPAGAPLRLSGYLNRVAGERIAYHSPHPEADTALLARSRRENHSITWQTDTVPATIAADTVEFTWVAGLIA